MKTSAAAAAVVVLAVSVATLVGSQELQPGEPLPGLTPEQLRAFDVGKEGFEETAGAGAGLGPFFNAASCAECHAHPTTGGVAPPDRPELRELRIGRLTTTGQFDPLLGLGGPVLHRQGLGDLPAAQTAGLPSSCASVRGTTTPPPEAQFASVRIPTPVFGAGLVEAIAAEELLRRADPGDRNRDGVSGRAHVVGANVGRFGWKAQHAGLMAFAGEASLTELGITNPLAPVEAHALRGGGAGEAARACDAVHEQEDTGEGVVSFSNFMLLLGPPPRGPITPPVVAGEQLFRRAGCDGCHVPELRTGPNAIAALHRKPVPLFSDLLLHDVGTGDGIVQGDATGREFRTAPLWGLRFRPLLLHDGRAPDVMEAIRAHRGEATRASDTVLRRFTARERESLLAFLRSL
ncbi:MAG TPA: di-heme oxidoredictase family protein [Methylomirabilota bacterium]|nr:di-heme oxidoredictase family protein [Methylomirabilota bacterium]